MREALLCLLLLVSGCGPGGGGGGEPRYAVGEAYQAGGVWRYPREDFEYSDTGLASTAAPRLGSTANGEAADATALVAGHRTLQLPAILRVTNLENGRSVVVRVNDRGPADPGRVIEVSRRTAQLLDAANPAAFRVRVEMLQDESRRLAFTLQNREPARPAARAPSAEAPKLAIAAAPRGGVQAEALAAPSGVAQSGRQVPVAAAPVVAATVVAQADVPLRLPEEIRMVSARPGLLAVECGAFGRPEYAEVLRRRIAQLGPRVTTDYNAPRDAAFLVRLGPFATTAQAEAALRRALAAGVPDARIVVE